jgi:hypothetical protein
MKLEVIPESTVLRLIKVRYPDSVEYHEVHNWCVANCKYMWYNGHDWSNWTAGEQNRCIEFDNQQDAMLFALRWT